MRGYNAVGTAICLFAEFRAGVVGSVFEIGACVICLGLSEGEEVEYPEARGWVHLQVDSDDAES